MNEGPSFWGNDHELSPLAEQLSELYIPMSGATPFVESEVLRAAIKIHYDYYNNGFGNNMSQSVRYIERFYDGLPAFNEAFSIIRAQALAPTGVDIPDVWFNTVLAEIILWVDAARKADRLTPLVVEIFDMDSTEMVAVAWPFAGIYSSYEEEEEEYDG